MTQFASSAAPTRYIDAAGVRYAYRRFGNERAGGRCLQHFTGTLDNWDPAIVDVLARDREIILFDNAGVGRSGGQVPTSIAHMAQHVLHFVDALSIDRLHILGFSLGGFRAGHRDRPTGTGRAVDPVRHRAGRRRRRGMDRPELLAIYTDGEMPMSEKLERLFFPATPRARRPPPHSSTASPRALPADLPAGPEVASAQLQAMIAWANWSGDVAGKLGRIKQPALVTNGNDDRMIPTANSFVLAQGLPDATLIVYPNSGHGALFQHASAYVAHVAEFLRGA